MRPKFTQKPAGLEFELHAQGEKKKKTNLECLCDQAGKVTG